jgi:hypothetical protein
VNGLAGVERLALDRAGAAIAAPIRQQPSVVAVRGLGDKPPRQKRLVALKVG